MRKDRSAKISKESTEIGITKDIHEIEDTTQARAIHEIEDTNQASDIGKY